MLSPSPSLIYQLFTGRLPWANYLHHPHQVFSIMAKHDFSHLHEFGINTLYLLGIWDNRSPIIVNQESHQDIATTPHRLPSPFAISDHTTPNPYLGNLASFKQLLSSLTSQEFRIIVDFVPNHTATTHPWVTHHPDFYLNHDQGFISEFNSDVYKLNYHNSALRQQMISILEQITSFGIDGFRCDMAHLVPLDFWHQAISHLKHSHPQLSFYAEVYPESPFDLSTYSHHIEAGFDGVYHGLLHHNLNQALSHPNTLSHLADHINYIASLPYTSHLINYLSNHDDPPPTPDPKYFPALSALILYLPGTPFFYNGTLNGFSRRLAHHYLDILPPSNDDTTSLHCPFSRLFDIKTDLNPHINSIQILPNQLLLAQCQTNSSSASLYTNLTSSPQPLSNLPTVTGLIHQLGPHSFLKPGQVELFTHP